MKHWNSGEAYIPTCQINSVLLVQWHIYCVMWPNTLKGMTSNKSSGCQVNSGWIIPNIAAQFNAVQL